MVDGKRMHISQAKKGQLGYDCWFHKYLVKACKGPYMQYWKFVDKVPPLPFGYENETEWHAAWKKAILDMYCEIVCGDNNEHRADIKTLERVIELQYSSLDVRDAIERTVFYYKLTGHRVIWVVNAYKARRDKRLNTRLDPDDPSRFFVDWKYPKKWVVDICKRTDANVYLDISPESNSLIYLWNHDGQLYGKWERKEVFYKKYLSRVATGLMDFLSAIKSVDGNLF